MNKVGFFIIEGMLYLTFALIGISLLLKTVTITVRLDETLGRFEYLHLIIIPAQHKILEDMLMAERVECADNLCTCFTSSGSIEYRLSEKRIMRKAIINKGASSSVISSSIHSFNCSISSNSCRCSITPSFLTTSHSVEVFYE